MKLRRWFQTGSIAILSLGPLVQAKWFCLPVLHCHSCPLAVFSCPIGILGHYLALGLAPLLLIGTILFIGALIGRALCGWVCPFGFLQDLLHKIPSPKFEPWRPLRYGKYLVLVLLAMAVPYFWGLESPLFFCRLCPAAAIEASIPFAVMEGGFSSFWGPMIRFSILGVILLLAVGSLRFFCRVLCPVGAITGLLNWSSAFALRHDTDTCPQCGLCTKACPVGVDLEEDRRGVVYKAPPDCILCLECTDACPTHFGLKGSFGGRYRGRPIPSPPEDIERPQPAE